MEQDRMKSIGPNTGHSRRAAGGGAEPSTLMHEARLSAVLDALLASGAQSVLDLGCGSGPLLARLARMPQFRRIVGVDIALDALQSIERWLGQEGLSGDGRISLLHGSFMEPNSDLVGFDAAVLVETIEHIERERLSCVERAVFAGYRPATVIITTPNSECNALLGVPEHRLRHPDHRFEWPRDKFRAWAGGVARRNGYDVAFADVGWVHPTFGAPTQMAIFTGAAHPIAKERNRLSTPEPKGGPPCAQD
jgi:3' terminal RNA ribose 2'-O-methyltransferase Hen1